MIARVLAAQFPNIIPMQADFTVPGFGELEIQELDGVLLANALHFVRDQVLLLQSIATRLRPRGRIVIAEYDRRESSRWVPYPASRATLESLAAGAGLSPPCVTATRPSEYQGEMYAAVIHAE